MSGGNRSAKYAPLLALGLVLVWALLCYLILLAPKRHRLSQVSEQLAQEGKKLHDMRQEIDNARIAGGPTTGESRFEKFGILARDEEQLFLRDLIDFCKETNNILNLVRRAEYTRRAPSTREEARQQEAGQPTTSATGAKAGETPQPVIDQVPHTVSFSGTFLSSFYLLRKLESYRRLLTVERVDLVTDTREGYPRLNGNITIDLYLAGVPSAVRAGNQGQGGAPATPEGAGTAESGGGR
jgi:hypothetical protein